MTKKILLKPRFHGWNIHSLYSELVNNPPHGYTIEYEDENELMPQVYQLDNKNTNPTLKELIYYFKPIPYIIAQYLQSSSFPGYDLVYASQHVLFKSDLPWITDLEFANALVAYGNLGLVKNTIQKALESEKCKFVLPWSEWSKKTLLNSIDCKNIIEKIEVVRYTVKPKKFVRSDKDTVNFLFVGSANKMNERNIRFKSLKEVILAFQRITKKFDNVSLTIRSFLTPDLKEMIKGNPNIISIESFLTLNDLYKLYEDADVFVLPSHETSGISLLDAMSFELSVIALNIYDIPEIITHMNNGILIDGHKEMKYYTNNKLPYEYSWKFLRDIKKYSNYLVDQLETCFIKLIQDSSLRKRLGKEARKTIESGKLSLEKRNSYLLSVFESATK